MGEDFEGQKRQQDMMQYSMATSFLAALVFGWGFHSLKAGWYTYFVGLVVVWLLSVVEWDYFFAHPSSWSEGKFLDVTGYMDLEARDRMVLDQARGPMPKLHRAQITLFGGPSSKMTISSRPPLPELRMKKW